MHNLMYIHEQQVTSPASSQINQIKYRELLGSSTRVEVLCRSQSLSYPFSLCSLVHVSKKVKIYIMSYYYHCLICRCLPIRER